MQLLFPEAWRPPGATQPQLLEGRLAPGTRPLSAFADRRRVPWGLRFGNPMCGGSLPEPSAQSRRQARTRSWDLRRLVSSVRSPANGPSPAARDRVACHEGRLSPLAPRGSLHPAAMGPPPTAGAHGSCPLPAASPEAAMEVVARVAQFLARPRRTFHGPHRLFRTISRAASRSESRRQRRWLRWPVRRIAMELSYHPAA